MDSEIVILKLPWQNIVQILLQLLFKLHSGTAPAGKIGISLCQTNSEAGCVVAFINIVGVPDSNPCSANKWYDHGIFMCYFLSVSIFPPVLKSQF